MFIYVFLLAIVVLLAALLSAMKFGFNRVVTGLQEIHAQLLELDRDRPGR